MSKIKSVEYGHMNWGPFVMKTKVPDYIITKLKNEGKKAKVNYSHRLAGHLDHQFLYPEKVQKWFSGFFFLNAPIRIWRKLARTAVTWCELLRAGAGCCELEQGGAGGCGPV